MIIKKRTSVKFQGDTTVIIVTHLIIVRQLLNQWTPLIILPVSTLEEDMRSVFVNYWPWIKINEGVNWLKLLSTKCRSPPALFPCTQISIHDVHINCSAFNTELYVVHFFSARTCFNIFLLNPMIVFAFNTRNVHQCSILMQVLQ